MLDRVTDPEEDKASDREKEALEKFSKARERFDEAEEEYARAAYDFGWNLGWDEGFNDGWEAAFEHIARREAEIKVAVKSDRPRTPPVAPAAAAMTQRTPVRRYTVAESVLEFVRRMPGLRGVDIARTFAGHSPATPERSVRTALRRLRIAKRLKSVGGKWYAVEDKE